MSGAAALAPTETAFYERPVAEVARALVGCVLAYEGASGRIVETEAYHQDEPACHAYAGLTARTSVLFGPPGLAYVYRSYGVHALLNAVCEPEGVGTAVLIRALEPLGGIDLMRERRGFERVEDLCSGPGKLTQALGIGLELNGTDLGGAMQILPAAEGAPAGPVVSDVLIGITRAMELPWRFCDASSRCVSRPWPSTMRKPRAGVRTLPQA